MNSDIIRGFEQFQPSNYPPAPAADPTEAAVISLLDVAILQADYLASLAMKGGRQ